jgi:acetoin utilization deacetylase AcuC-like enzyme
MRPDLLFYLSGVDILETDKLGRLGVSKQGCLERDRIVLKTSHQHGIPVVVCMGGGYSPRLSDIVEAHIQTYRVASSLYF